MRLAEKPLNAGGPARVRERMPSTLDYMATEVAKWILAAVFLTLPLNTLRPVQGDRARGRADRPPPAGRLLPVRDAFPRRPADRQPAEVALDRAPLLLLASMALVELVPVINPERLVDSFDSYTLETGSSVVVGMRVIFALVAFPIVIGVVADRWSTIRLLVNCWIVGSVDQLCRGRCSTSSSGRASRALSRTSRTRSGDTSSCSRGRRPGRSA